MLDIDSSPDATIPTVVETLNQYDTEVQAHLADLQTWGHTLDAKNSELNEQVAELTEKNAELTLANTDLTLKVAQLQAQIDGQTPPDPDPTPTDPEPTPTPTATVIIGLSAKQAEWDEQIGNIGTTGIKARRIFADLAQGGLDQQDLIKKAVADGEMPVVSWKIGNDVTGAKAGNYDQAAAAAGTFLRSLRVPVRGVFWHEPNPDLSAANYVAIYKRFIPLLGGGQVKLGTFINGWLLEKNEDVFTPYVPDDLLAQLDWWGIDAYHAGTMTDPDPINTPGRRIRNMLVYAEYRKVTLPIGIGEYNGFTAAAIKEAGDVILSNADKIEFACMWSSQGARGNDFRLTGDRLAAFKSTLADPRVAK